MMLDQKTSFLLWILMAIFFVIPLGYGEESVEEEERAGVYVIPIEGQINDAQLFILRRALKEASAEGVETAVLEIDTPGGALTTTLDIMEVIGNFDGEVIAFVNPEAISAGAYISIVCDEIYMAPKGVIGSAAAIQTTGAEVPETLQNKIYSYLRAIVRSHTKDYRYRGDVLRAMMDEKFELKIGDEVIKSKGELLTLTADEAVERYGSPPESLLAAGIVDSTKDLLDLKFGEGAYEIRDFEVTWSEELARWLSSITPILMGMGLFLLFIEFKTPGFGVFGIFGVGLLLVVFASSYVAGLAGYEEVLFFALGVLLLGVELFLLPGIVIAGVLGVALIFGSLVWALADIWPTKNFDFSGDVFLSPLVDLGIGMAIAVVGILVLGRYVLKGWLWDVLVLKSAVTGRTGQVETRVDLAEDEEAGVGARGVVVADLHPSGEVEIDGVRYQARVAVGDLHKGERVVVVGKEGFSLIVEKEKE